jgi:hypothetical protein
MTGICDRLNSAGTRELPSLGVWQRDGQPHTQRHQRHRQVRYNAPEKTVYFSLLNIEKVLGKKESYKASTPI